MENKIIGYKFIQKDMKSRYGNVTWKKGVWKKHQGEIQLYGAGFHACRTPAQSLKYRDGNRWFIVEARGKFKGMEGDRFVASEMRLVQELPKQKILSELAMRLTIECINDFQKECLHGRNIKQIIQPDFLLKELAQQNWGLVEKELESAWSTTTLFVEQTPEEQVKIPIWCKKWATNSFEETEEKILKLILKKYGVNVE